MDWVWVPFNVDARFEGYRVDRFLAQRLAAYSRGRIQKILEESRVIRLRQGYGGQSAMKASARVRGGDQILIAYPRQSETPLPDDAALPILFEDEHLIVVDKPANLLSHPTDKISLHTVLGVLRHARPDLQALHLLHRLDRDTSGVLALGKTPAAARAWTGMMEERRIKKEYLALVRGVPHPRQGVLNQPIGRQNGAIKVRQWVNVPGAVSAVTRYEVRASHQDFSLVRLFPETGRLHQIRVHMAAFGHPVLGDVLYHGDGALYMKMTRRQLTAEDRASVGFSRVALHAAVLQLAHPMTARPLVISAPFPADLTDFLKAREMGKSDTLTAA